MECIGAPPADMCMHIFAEWRISLTQMRVKPLPIVVAVRAAAALPIYLISTRSESVKKKY